MIPKNVFAKFIVLLTSVVSVRCAANEWDQEFHKDVSASTFYGVKNISTDYKFNYSTVDALMGKFRRQLIFGRWVYKNTKHDYEMEMYIKACLMITNSYRNAFVDFRRYFPIRTTYVENIEYEVGYLTYHIVHKYQSVLEVFHLAYRRYALQPKTEVAPANYMLYLYRVIAESCKVIVHLCNMMHELKRKYKGYDNSIFIIFSELNATSKAPRPDLKEIQNKVVQSFNALEAKKKKERRERRKKQAAGILEEVETTKRPRKGRFPLVYGWSIEDWWI